MYHVGDRALLQGAELRPVFQDPSRRRWHGFLSFAGSGTATLVFLAAMLWISVSVTPELTPLPDTIQASQEPVPEPRLVPLDTTIAVSNNAIAPESGPGPAVPVEPWEAAAPAARHASIMPKPSAETELKPALGPAATIQRTQPINSASIETLGPPSGDGWVVVPGAAGGSIQELTQ